MLTDLRKLGQVIGVAQAGSFTAAAQILAISQSALTKSVADVEAQLGLKLFDRLPRGVRLTDAGRTFVGRAKQILADTEDLMNEIGGYRELRSGRLRIGVAPAAYLTFLERPLAAFASTHSGIALEVHQAAFDHIAGELIGGALDLVVGATNFIERWPDLLITPVAELHINFIARKDHPATRITPLTEKELLSFPLVSPITDPLVNAFLSEVYARNDLAPHTAHYQCDDFNIVRSLVRETDAISPMVTLAQPGRALRQEFYIFDGVVDFGRQEVGVAQARSRPASPSARAFMQAFADGLSDR